MLKIAICDDERVSLQLAQEEVKRYLETKEVVRSQIYTFSSGKELLAALEQNEFSIVLLDIDMPEMTGFEVAEQLEMLSENTNVVFISSQEHLVYESFLFQPKAFVRKRLLREEIERAMDICLKHCQREEASIYIKSAIGMEQIYIKDILYFESCKHNLSIVTIHGNYEYRGNISDREEELKPLFFLRVHIGYLVNPRYIKKLDIEEIELTDGTRIPISRRRLKQIQMQYMLYKRKSW